LSSIGVENFLVHLLVNLKDPGSLLGSCGCVVGKPLGFVNVLHHMLQKSSCVFLYNRVSVCKSERDSAVNKYGHQIKFN
jgi:hypothetical protein